MSDKKPEVETPPIWYRNSDQDGVYGTSKKEKIKQEIQVNLIERINNFVSEKKSCCLEKGLSCNDTNHILTQIIKNIPVLILPLS